jgi:hypothetical protein
MAKRTILGGEFEEGLAGGNLIQGGKTFRKGRGKARPLH